MKEIFKYLIQYCIFFVVWCIYDLATGKDINSYSLLHTLLILILAEGVTTMYNKIKASFKQEIEEGVYCIDE